MAGLFDGSPPSRNSLLDLARPKAPPDGDGLPDMAALHDALYAGKASDAAPAPAYAPGDQLEQAQLPPSETADDTASPLPYPPPPRPEKRDLSKYTADNEDQISNIVFNETRSLSGPGIQDARRKMALTIMNAVKRWPDETRYRLARTAPNVLPPSLDSKEQAFLGDVRDAVRRAAIIHGSGGDEVDGAVHYTLPKASDPRPTFFGLPLHSRLGPFSDSFRGTPKAIHFWLDPAMPTKP
jgi:hypothetical protein